MARHDYSDYMDYPTIQLLHLGDRWPKTNDEYGNWAITRFQFIPTLSSLARWKLVIPWRSIFWEGDPRT